MSNHLKGRVESGRRTVTSHWMLRTGFREPTKLIVGPVTLLVLGAVLLSTSAWYWPFIVVLAGPVAALIVITIHNRKTANQSAAHNASAQ